MYNEEVKYRFLETRKNEGDPTVNRKEMALEALEEQEAALGKDFGAMTREEMIHSIAEVSSSYGGLLLRMKYLRDYLRWYDENVSPISYKDANFEWSDIDLTESFRRKLIHSVDQIVADWNDYPAYNGDYPQPLFIVVWYGLDLKQALELKDSDVVDEGERFVIHYNGREVVVDDPSAIRVLRYYQSWHEDQEWYRSKTDRFFYRRIRHGATDKCKPQVATNVSIRMTNLKNQKDGKYIFDRYAANNVKIAGMCYHVIKLQNAGATKEEIEDLEKFYGFYSPQSLRTGIIRRSIECYRKAFNL